MKFTSEDLMYAMGLAVGDTIKLNGKTHTFTTKKDGTLICKNVLKHLIDQEFELIPRPKRIGDLNCMEFKSIDHCSNCPIRVLCSLGATDHTTSFYALFDNFTTIDLYDKEIYNLIESRLDKEVRDND